MHILITRVPGEKCLGVSISFVPIGIGLAFSVHAKYQVITHFGPNNIEDGDSRDWYNELSHYLEQNLEENHTCNEKSNMVSSLEAMLTLVANEAMKIGRAEGQGLLAEK